LIYYEACKNKERAIKREKSLKTGFGRKFLENRI
jgi:predicted GIY-YIG superfamily endonuclease